MSGPARDATLMKRAAIASLSVSLGLVAIKVFAYFASNSVAMLASMADSALDVFTSAINLFAITEALTPADHEHRFGHGKAEPLAGMAQAAFICASALFIAVQAVGRILEPAPLDHALPALVVMGVSIIAAIGLILYERHVVAKTRSVAIGADALHYLGDLATNLGVVVAIAAVTWLGWTLADPIIALCVGAGMLFSAALVMRKSLDQLMDHELPDTERARIIAIIKSHPDVQSLHDLRTRQAGLSIFIQAHLVMDPAMDLARAHAISDAVEREICTAFPDAQIIIHQDPAGLEPEGPETPLR